jgi:hypothetical protein
MCISSSAYQTASFPGTSASVKHLFLDVSHVYLMGRECETEQYRLTNSTL